MNIFKVHLYTAKLWKSFFITFLQIRSSKLLTRLSGTCSVGRGLLYYQIVPLILMKYSEVPLWFFSPLKQFLCYFWQLENKQNLTVPFLERFFEGFLCPLSIQQCLGVIIIRHNPKVWEINSQVDLPNSQSYLTPKEKKNAEWIKYLTHSMREITFLGRKEACCISTRFSVPG